MTNIQFNKCLGVTTVFREYKETSRIKNATTSKSRPSILTTSAGSYQESYTLLKNKTYFFYYYLRNQIKTFHKNLVGTVNSNRVRFCGIQVPAREALLVDMSHKIVEGFSKDKPVTCTRVEVEIEVQIEKPLYETSTFDMDYFFIDSKGKRRRVQFSSEPELYLNNKAKYPNAEEVFKGYGFYSETCPELNTAEPVFLDGNGGILKYDTNTPAYIKKVNYTEASWDNLSIPAL